MKKAYERLNYKSHNKNPMLPPVDLEDAKHGFFVYDSEVYEVKTAPDAIFRVACYALSPTWKSAPQYSRLLNSEQIDFFARWYLLCELANAKRPMKLHTKREEICNV